MEETGGIELDNLCPQVIDSIFSRIPLKFRARLKPVSRAWREFIKENRRCYPLTTTSGLTILLKHLNKNLRNQDFQESTFIKTQEGQEVCLTTHAFIRHKFLVHLVDSCNGLLLYATNDGLSWTYYICSPFQDQCLSLPRVHDIRRLACASLSFDETNQENYGVLCFFLKEVGFVEGTIGCKLFSSETWDWREFRARIYNTDLLLKRDFDPEHLFGPSVFCRGRLYWIWSLCMLVYDNEAEFFKLVLLPPSKTEEGNVVRPLNLLSQLLWESDGSMYFCYQINEGLCIYKFIGDDQVLNQERDYCSMEGCCLWQFNQFVALKEFIWRELDFVINGKVKSLRAKCRIRPCAFNQDLQRLYLHLPPGTIVSYSLETQELEQVWACDEFGGAYAIEKILPFLFKSVNLCLLN